MGRPVLPPQKLEQLPGLTSPHHLQGRAVLEAYRKKEDATVEDTPIFVGIDVSKARLDVALSPSGTIESVLNEEAATQALVQRLGTSQVALIVLEATGGIEQPLVRALVSTAVSGSEY